MSSGSGLYIIINTLAGGLGSYTSLGSDGYAVAGALVIEGLAIGTEVGAFVLTALLSSIVLEQASNKTSSEATELVAEMKSWKTFLVWSFLLFAGISLYFNALHGHDFATAHPEKLYLAVVAGSGTMPVLAYLGLYISMYFLKLALIIWNGMPREAKAPKSTPVEHRDSQEDKTSEVVAVSRQSHEPKAPAVEPAPTELREVTNADPVDSRKQGGGRRKVRVTA